MQMIIDFIVAVDDYCVLRPLAALDAWAELRRERRLLAKWLSVSNAVK